MHLTLTIANNVGELEEVMNWIKSHLPSVLTEKIKNNILLVGQELVANAIVHGNKSVESKIVIITLEIEGSKVLLEVQDEGPGLPTLPTKEEAKKMNTFDENGRGMKLAVYLSTKVSVRKNKISVTFN